MKYTGTKEALKKLGYSNNINNEYHFKTERKTVDYGYQLNTTIYISNNTGEISFGGSDYFKENLLNELKKELEK